MMSIPSRNSTRIGVRTMIAVLFLTFVFPAVLASGQSASRGTPGPKYIFLFLSDGGGMAHLQIARQYRQVILNEPFVIVDKIIKEGSVGIMTTHAANSLSTDSAAAATALAGGCKANVGALGMCADGSIAVSAMEVARRRGMGLALVTNGTVYDASPAAFVCHVPNRRDYAAIIDSYLEMEPDVLMGGGKDQFLPKGRAESRRKDSTDVIAAFESKGYRLALNKIGLEEKAPAGKLLGLFAPRDMSFDLDRDKNAEPSVFDMTRATIDLLHTHHPRGFFAFIEAESIDTASHLSDIASVVHEYREFDRAVGLAYEFYRKYPRETLILVASDHETGGLGFTAALKDLSDTRGTNQTAATYKELKKIQSINISLQKASQILGRNPTPEAVDELMREHFAGFNLDPEFKDAIVRRRPISRTLITDFTAQALGAMVANNTQAYWQTSAHTNQPVLVAALGVGADRFKGYYDNADFGKILKGLLEQKVAAKAPQVRLPAKSAVHK